MKKISFCLSLCIIILSFANNVFAEEILIPCSNMNYDNEENEITISDIFIEEDMEKVIEDVEFSSDTTQKYDIIVSGSALKFDNIDNDFIDDKSDMRASYPDLTITSLTASGTYPFTAFASASFEFKLSNIGSAGASNIYIGIYVDNNLVGKAGIGSLSAGYTFNGNMNLDKVPDGTHAVKLVADVDNKIVESNENNNTITKSFNWIGTPDLTATVVNPVDTEVMADTDTQFKFYVNNIGNGKGSGTIPVEILVDDSVLATLSINPVTAKSQTLVECTINFGYALGEYEVKIRVNNNRSFTESNYNNNSASRKYNIEYCTHFLEENKFPMSVSDRLKIQVKSSATDVFSKDIFFEVANWNGITSEVKIETLLFSDGDNDANIVVEGFVFDDNVTLGQTLSVENLRLIRLSIDEDSLSTMSEENQIRTYLHEVGHALGLAHPKDDINSDDCEYKALMRQTKDNLMTLNLTNHDRYNLIKLYE